ncbi:hypothetical protein Q2333_07725, partial [Escherichia coli]|nr:hypothetical protein [Escherichia coli]
MIFSDWPWRHWRQVRGEAIALRLNDEQLNWRELCARVDELASSFAVQGVVEGSSVCGVFHARNITLLPSTT